MIRAISTVRIYSYLLSAILLVLVMSGCVSLHKYSRLEEQYKNLKAEADKKVKFGDNTLATIGNVSALSKFVMLEFVSTDSALLDRLGSPLIKEGDSFRSVSANYRKADVNKKVEVLSESNLIESVEEVNGSLAAQFGVHNTGISANDITNHKRTFDIEQKLGAIINLSELDKRGVINFCRRHQESGFIITGSTRVTVRTSLHRKHETGAEISAPAFSLGGQIYEKTSDTSRSSYNGVLYTKCQDAIEYYNSLLTSLAMQKIRPVPDTIVSEPKPYHFSADEMNKIRAAYKVKQ